MPMAPLKTDCSTRLVLRVHLRSGDASVQFWCCLILVQVAGLFRSFHVCLFKAPCRPSLLLSGSLPASKVCGLVGVCHVSNHGLDLGGLVSSD